MVSDIYIFNPYLGMIGPSDSYFCKWIENTNRVCLLIEPEIGCAHDTQLREGAKEQRTCRLLSLYSLQMTWTETSGCLLITHHLHITRIPQTRNEGR